MDKIFKQANPETESGTWYKDQAGNEFYLKEVQPSLKEDEWKEKAEKWDALEDKISKFYFDDDGEEKEDDDGGDLCDIGEAAAMAFGFL